MKKDEVIQLEHENIMQTYGRFPVVLVSGKGSMVYDIDGKEYVDMTSGIGVNSLGYSNEKYNNALKEQIGNILHTSNIFYNPKTVELAEKLMKVSGMSKVFFSNSGAEANEGAIKLARKYSAEKYGEARYKIITLKSSFHGRTITTLAATGQDKFHKDFKPLTTGFDYVERNNIEELAEKIDSSVCAVMMEAIQGEGGVFPLDPEYVNAVRELCNEKDIALIFDEVQCGIGRTGEVFGYDNFGIKPDIVTVAKGLGGGVPIGGFMCNEKFAAVLNKGDHGSTFGGNPLVCAAGVEVLNQVINDEFLDEVKSKGQYLREKIMEINSPKIKEIRGAGLMIGVEISCEASEVINKAIEKGALFLTAGKNVIRMLPPLVITKDEIDTAVEILKEALEA
ncbi:MAG: aspartate aminotransferase family protein [Bacillota bacterium]|nr:aspartate aminotransferase family protein [Bacillota bacterium]